MSTTAATTAATIESTEKIRTILARNWRTIVQLLLVTTIVHIYDIEGESFVRVVILASAGFIVSLFTPLALRLQFFVVLSLVGIVWVLGLRDGSFLLVTGMTLIGIVNLPIGVRYRLLVLATIIALLVLLRSGWGDTPWSSGMWPILGSMFMFRLILYFRAVDSGKTEKGVWGALAYFFMLPNVAFPLFPVVDYQTFHRTYFDRDSQAIYEQGMLWIARGLVHLVLYRAVYYYVIIDPRDVLMLSDLVQYMLGTLLLYLKVSGQFHMIVGVLHLFGFRLPETHKLYYLSHSFTELWRRINIYWTEFMMKVFFYPTYFRVKHIGPTRALVVSTIVVFIATWLLHSYQWFWLRGGFPITVQDTLFWAILGALVVFGALKELKGSKTPKPKTSGWNPRMGFKAGKTFLIFCLLWSLWSTDSFGQWIWTLSAASNVDLAGLIAILAIFVVIMFFGGWDWEAIQKNQSGSLSFLGHISTRTFLPLILLVLLAQPGVLANLPNSWSTIIGSLQVSKLNTQDAASRHRGYYEQLDIRHRLTDNASEALGELRDNWQSPADAGIIRETNDILTRDLRPLLNIIWNGNRFTTNSLGMRDREYDLEKPTGTFRIAFLGPSHVMGNGVADDETFESLLEERLNADLVPDGYDHVEILNFGVDGYSIPQQLAMLEDRVFNFKPDLVLATVYHQSNTMTEGYLTKLITRDVRPIDDQLRKIYQSSGLEDVDLGSVSIPFESLRSLASRIGISPRMPAAELSGRIHRISRQVDEWAIAKIANLSRQHDASAIVVAIDVVRDSTSEQVPNLEAIERSGMPLLNLFDIFADEDTTSLRIAPWDDHPNAIGHRLIADRLFDLLLPELNRLTIIEQASATLSRASALFHDA